MTALELIKKLTESGVHLMADHLGGLKVVGDKVQIQANIELIREHKTEILTEITSRQTHCSAYPKTGAYAGASWSWCLVARGRMPACEDCPWGHDTEINKIQ
jgi:hypothetical protein